MTRPAATDLSSAPLRVLLIEDNPGDARLIRETLKDIKDFRFTLEHLGLLAEGLKRLASEKPDVLLLDLSLPDSAGLDTVARVRQQAPSLPVVVLTGLNDENTGIEAVKIGAQDFLVKGQADGALLGRALRYAVERKRAEEQVRRQQEQIAALYEIGKAISSTLDIQAIAGRLLEKIDLLLPPGTAVALSLWHPANQALEVIGCGDIGDGLRMPGAAAVASRLDRLVCERMAPVAMSNARADADYFSGTGGFSAYAGVPIVFNRELLGVLACYATDGNSFHAHEVACLAALAGQIGTAIHNARLYQRSLTQGVEFERANKVKGDFLGVVSHELKTPVTMIMGYTTMVKDRSLGPLSDDQEGALMAVESCSHDLLKVINNILQATDIESRALSVASEDFRLDRLFADLRSEFAGNFEAGLALDWDAASESPVMHSDYEKVKQILRHLIDNAVKFSGNHRVKLSARYQTENDRVEFQVADSGPGIPKENRSTIFEKFFQIDGTSARTYGGVGLGLYITKRFAELLGGKIDLDSEREGGTTFVVTLPCRYTVPAAQV